MENLTERGINVDDTVRNNFVGYIAYALFII